MRCHVVLLILAMLTIARAAPQKNNKQNAGTTTPASATLQKEHRSVMASQIVHELKNLAHKHKLPAALHDVTNFIPYGHEEDYDGYDHDHEVYKLYGGESPTIDPNTSPTGFNVKGVLGLVEYLILLILLKGSINHIAERYRKSRGFLKARSSEEDLKGVAEEMKKRPSNHDMDQKFSSKFEKYSEKLKQEQLREQKNKILRREYNY